MQRYFAFATTPLSLSLVLSVLLSTGCSQSLQGIAYERGEKPAEFHYPNVQYGVIKSVSSANGSSSPSENVNTFSSDDTEGGPIIDPRVSREVSSRPTKSASNTADMLANEKKSDKSYGSTSKAKINEAPKIMQNIKSLGVYNFNCHTTTAGNECTYSGSQESRGRPTTSTAANLPQNAKIKVVLDSGKTYWFDQPISANWVPQNGDRVKVFFDENDPAAETASRAIKIQYGINESSSSETAPSSEPSSSDPIVSPETSQP
ncbi:MAG: hypothetical protein V4525_05110 [Pseudomonadota bacterium]